MSAAAKPAKKQSAKPASKQVTPARNRTKVAELHVEDKAKIAGLTIKRLPLPSLKPHPRNPRKHPEAGSPEWLVLESSLKHDYFDPLVWNSRNGMLVSGHLRTKVLKHLGFTHADVVIVDYDEPTHIARLMAANKGIGEDDLPAVKSLLGELKELPGFDLAVAGFTLAEFDARMLEGVSEDPSIDSEGTHDASGGMSPAEIDSRIRYLTEAIGSPVYPIEAGQVAVIDKAIALLCAFTHASLPSELVRWIEAKEPAARQELGGAAGASKPVRLLYGPDALTLVEKGPEQLAPGYRWVIICPTVISARTLLAVHKAHYKAKAKVKIVAGIAPEA